MRKIRAQHVRVDIYRPGVKRFQHAGAVLFGRGEESAKKGFVYNPSYNFFPIDPINLNYNKHKGIFGLSCAVSKGRVIHDLFRDALPAVFASRMITAKYPEYAYMDDFERLLFAGSRQVNGIRLYVMGGIRRARGAQNSAELIEFSDQVREVELGSRPFLSDKFISEMRVADGGARKKWGFRDIDGHEWVVKFAEFGDAYVNANMEVLMLKIMADAGIDSPYACVEKLNTGEAVALIKRFDLDGHGGMRMHKISMASLLGRRVGVDFRDMANVLRQVSANPEVDLLQLYRSAVFDCVIGNHDNHAKNFEMILCEEGYRLSPQYDKLPDYSNSQMATHFCGYPNADVTDRDFIARTAKGFGIDAQLAKEAVEAVISAIKNTRSMAASMSITKKDFDYLVASVENNSPTLAGILNGRTPSIEVARKNVKKLEKGKRIFQPY